jgi:hypothetical protein
MEDRISGLEDKEGVIEKSANDKEKRMKRYEQNMQEFWDSIKRPNL